MEIVNSLSGIRQLIHKIKLQRKTLGFVPTMGALHNGHLELVRNSINQNDVTMCSIFVNPSQFNNPEDLINYPRDTEADISKLKSLECDAVFIPPANAMYSEQSTLNFDFGYLETIMEGKFRPGHFKGVGLIIAKLFNLMEPDRAYFGEKDLQQFAIIKKLATELFFNVEIISVPTVREENGLAMSSRNKLLSETDRAHASDLINALTIAQKKLIKGETVVSVKKYVIDLFETESKIKLEYFEIVRTTDLQNISQIKDHFDVSLCIAGYLGKVRLIDNISLN